MRFLKHWSTALAFPVLLLIMLAAMSAQLLRSPSDPLKEAHVAGRTLTSAELEARATALVAAFPIGGGMAGEVVNFPISRSIYMEQYIDPDQRDDATVNGGDIDLEAVPYQQFDHFAFLVLIGDTDITIDFTIEDSADGSSWAALLDADAVAVALTQITATDDDKFAVVEVTTKAYTVRRHIRGVLVVGDGTLGADNAVILLGYGFEGETPTPAATDRLELVVPASAT